MQQDLSRSGAALLMNCMIFTTREMRQIFRAFEENWLQRIRRLKSPQPLPEGTLAGAAEDARRVLREEVLVHLSTRGMSLGAKGAPSVALFKETRSSRYR
jgi:hypothetical protein